MGFEQKQRAENPKQFLSASWCRARWIELDIATGPWIEGRTMDISRADEGKRLQRRIKQERRTLLLGEVPT